LSTVGAEPSPQVIVTVCGSSLPGSESVKVPDRVVEPPSLIVPGAAASAVITGATLASPAPHWKPAVAGS
jgi:hypothetical protein